MIHLAGLMMQAFILYTWKENIGRFPRHKTNTVDIGHFRLPGLHKERFYKKSGCASTCLDTQIKRAIIIIMSVLHLHLSSAFNSTGEKIKS